jgi:hypothetical protein
MILPNPIWNIQYHFPFVELMANIRHSGRNTPLAPLQFLGQQALNELPANLPIWLAGLWYFFFARNGKPYRVLGWTLAESRGNFEDPLVPCDDQYLSHAVVHRCAAMAAVQMFFDLLTHLRRGISVQKGR